MTPTIPSSEPATIVRGDSTKWTRGFSEYLPADGWALSYWFSGIGFTPFSVGASDNGDGMFLVTLATADTKKLEAGSVRWQATVTKASERVTLANGVLTAVEGLASVAGEGPVDLRTTAQQTLDALEATLLGRATSDQLSVSINGRSISRLTIAELRDWRDQLRAEVAVQEQGDAAGLGRQIRVRYGAF